MDRLLGCKIVLRLTAIAATAAPLLLATPSGPPPRGWVDISETLTAPSTPNPLVTVAIQLLAIVALTTVFIYLFKRFAAWLLLDQSDLLEASDSRASRRKMPSFVIVLPLPSRHRENLLGDLEQEYNRAFDRLGFRKATFWLFKQTLREIPYAFYLRLQAIMFRLLRKLGS